jgi:hypothetical protein
MGRALSYQIRQRFTSTLSLVDGELANKESLKIQLQPPSG